MIIGLQVPTIIERIEDADEVTLGLYALLITAVVMGMRALWMLVVPTILHSETTVAERIVIAWSGMRGGVSLAAALAITVDGFPNRDLVIFVAYAVIVLTLVLPGLTLSTLVKRLGLQESEEHRRARPRRACGSRRPRSNGSTSSKATRPSTSCSGCATATARGWSGSRRAWRATRTRAARPTSPRRAS